MKEIVLFTRYLSSLGGGEKYVLVLAQVLAHMKATSVSLLYDNGIERSQLERYFDVDLSDIDFIPVGGIRDISRLTSKADVFVYLSNVRRINSGARTQVQLLQIPFGRITAGSIARKIGTGKMKEAAKDVYRLRLLSYARTTASSVITNSQFVHDVLEKNFGIRSNILHPPILDFRRGRIARKKQIVSVGRFFAGLYNEKRYDLLTTAFRGLSEKLPGWEYHIAGSASPDPGTRRLVEQLKEANRGYRIVFHLNSPIDTLVRLYNEGSIFWHAAGYGVDEERHPENVEHFGMTTVEAMSAGCIPIVTNKGGQREIVSDGQNGFLWNSPEELKERTISVAHGDSATLRRLRGHARRRYEDFSLDRFRLGATGIFGPLLRT